MYLDIVNLSTTFTVKKSKIDILRFYFVKKVKSDDRAKKKHDKSNQNNVTWTNVGL